MKNYTITYTTKSGIKTWEEKSGMGMFNTIKFFVSSMNESIDNVVSVSVKEIAQDNLIQFLDNNPANTDYQPKQELTKREKELIWLADLEATQRYEHELNGFHL